jgi:hypothetical protein
MPRGISNGDGTALGDAEKRKAVYPNCIYHGFKVANPCLKRNLIDVSIREPVASCVVSNQGAISCQSLE